MLNCMYLIYLYPISVNISNFSTYNNYTERSRLLFGALLNFVFLVIARHWVVGTAKEYCRYKQL